MPASIEPRREAAALGQLSPPARLRRGLLRFPALSAFVLFATLAALTKAAFWDRTPGFDAGQYLYVGGVILDGDAPYVDAANNKGPVLFLLFALIRLVAGTSTAPVWIAALIFAALAALALAGYVASYAGRSAGFATGLIFAVLGAAALRGNEQVGSEQFGVAPMVGALWLASLGGAASTAGAGALTAAAMLMNPAFGIVLPFVVFQVWRSSAGGERSKRFALGAAGGIAVAVPVIAWLGILGALDDMTTQVLGQVAQVTGLNGSVLPRRAQPDGFELTAAREFPSIRNGGVGAVLSFPNQALTGLGLLGSAIALRAPRLRVLAVGAALWIVAVWARGKLATYSLPQNYYIATPGIAVGVGVGLVSLWRGRLLDYRLAIAAACLVAVLWSPVLVSGVWPLLRSSGGGNSEVEAVAEFVRSNTAPDDQMIATNPEIYWLADRRAPTPFFDLYGVRPDADYVSERRGDLLSDPPEALVLAPVGFKDEPLTKLIERLAATEGYRWNTVDGIPVFLRVDRRAPG